MGAQVSEPQVRVPLGCGNSGRECLSVGMWMVLNVLGCCLMNEMNVVVVLGVDFLSPDVFVNFGCGDFDHISCDRIFLNMG